MEFSQAKPALDLTADARPVTEEKVAEAIRRLVDSVGPLEVIAFGSRVRGDQRPDSDLDIAVIL